MCFFQTFRVLRFKHPESQHIRHMLNWGRLCMAETGCIGEAIIIYLFLDFARTENAKNTSPFRPFNEEEDNSDDENGNSLQISMMFYVKAKNNLKFQQRKKKNDLTLSKGIDRTASLLLTEADEDDDGVFNLMMDDEHM